MSYLGEYPELLSQLEFVRLRIRLEYQEEALLPPGYGLRLRRELRPVAQQLLPVEEYTAIFEPPVPTDPLLIRLVQRPAPAFALQPRHTEALTRVAEGDEEILPMACFGSVCGLLPQIVETITALGKIGIAHGTGKFELLSVASADLQGNWRPIWRSGQSTTTLAPQLLNAVNWLEGTSVPTRRGRLQWQTPLRLIVAGRPLFRPDFKAFFPFLLRRFTSLTLHGDGHAWSDAVAELLQESLTIKSDGRNQRWEDWRMLEGPADRVELGGVRGEMVVEGASLERLAWLLQLGTLMNVGKGASYGAGQYTLVFDT